MLKSEEAACNLVYGGLNETRFVINLSFPSVTIRSAVVIRDESSSASTVTRHVVAAHVTVMKSFAL